MQAVEAKGQKFKVILRYLASLRLDGVLEISSQRGRGMHRDGRKKKRRRRKRERGRGRGGMIEVVYNLFPQEKAAPKLQDV